MRFDVLLAVLHICPWEVRQRLRSCSATCKLLCISCLTEIRVVVFTTLKIPKSLIVSVIRAARPGGSCQTALCLMKLQYFRTIIFYPDLSRYKNFSIFASSKQPQT